MGASERLWDNCISITKKHKFHKKSQPIILIFQDGTYITVKRGFSDCLNISIQIKKC